MDKKKTLLKIVKQCGKDIHLLLWELNGVNEGKYRKQTHDWEIWKIKTTQKNPISYIQIPWETKTLLTI